MRRFIPVLFISCVCLCAQSFNGRWDLTITTPKDTYPSWLEVKPPTDVRVVGRVSGGHPVSDLKLYGSHMSFTTSEWFGKPIRVSWDMTVSGTKISGTQKRADGVTGQISGVPAPALNRTAPTSWRTPESLFDGKDLNGWEPDEPSKNHWKAINGELVNESAGANIRTSHKYEDFKLHIEYRSEE